MNHLAISNPQTKQPQTSENGVGDGCFEASKGRLNLLGILVPNPRLLRQTRIRKSAPLPPVRRSPERRIAPKDHAPFFHSDSTLQQESG